MTKVIHGDCIEVMMAMPANSIDAIVTDPPYGLGFMGKAWDDLPPGEEWAVECLRVLKPGGHLIAFGGTRTWHRLAVAIEDAGFEIRDSIAWMYGSGFPKNHNVGTSAGPAWEGWGTALKPAFEPIVMARKPLQERTVAANVLKHGTGALNIDGTRVATTDSLTGGVSPGSAQAGWERPFMSDPKALAAWAAKKAENQARAGELGRHPANVCLDESMANALDGQTAELTGNTSKFFYVAKPPQKERPKVNGITHPTVKPLTLMQWLVRLVTPVGGTVLDPFAGSGTTVEACILEGFSCIAIERESEYLPLIQERINRQSAEHPEPVQEMLNFGGAA